MKFQVFSIELKNAPELNTYNLREKYYDNDLTVKAAAYNYKLSSIIYSRTKTPKFPIINSLIEGNASNLNNYNDYEIHIGSINPFFEKRKLIDRIKQSDKEVIFIQLLPSKSEFILYRSGKVFRKWKDVFVVLENYIFNIYNNEKKEKSLATLDFNFITRNLVIKEISNKYEFRFSYYNSNFRV